MTSSANRRRLLRFQFASGTLNGLRTIVSVEGALSSWEALHIALDKVKPKASAAGILFTRIPPVDSYALFKHDHEQAIEMSFADV